jgi:hypothetical protein
LLSSDENSGKQFLDFAMKAICKLRFGVDKLATSRGFRLPWRFQITQPIEMPIHDGELPNQGQCQEIIRPVVTHDLNMSTKDTPPANSTGEDFDQ